MHTKFRGKQNLARIKKLRFSAQVYLADCDPDDVSQKFKYNNGQIVWAGDETLKIDNYALTVTSSPYKTRSEKDTYSVDLTKPSSYRYGQYRLSAKWTLSTGMWGSVENVE